MEYSKEIESRIKNSDKWPSFDRSEFLSELDSLASEFISKNTIEGYLAALLIFQQLAEEMIKVYLEDHEFFMQLSVYPAELKSRKRPKAMFGRIIEDLKNTVTIDEKKEEIIGLANQLNKIRIDIVHGLTKFPNISTIQENAQKAKSIYEEFYEKFDEEHDMFKVIFKDYKKDWDDMQN